MRWYREAFSLLRRDHELRRLAARPMWASLLAFVVVFGLTVWLLGSLVASLLSAIGAGSLAGPVGILLAAIGVFAFSGVLFLGVASLVGSAFWDRLTHATETRVSAEVPTDPPTAIQIGDTVKRLVFSLCMALLSLCLGFLIPVVGPVIVAGYTAMVDATGGSFLRRGIGLGGQLLRVVRLPGALGFLVIAGALSVVPLLNVFALPLTMTAGALMATHGLSAKALDKPARNLDTI